MALLPILRWPDERLETRCAPVTGDVSALAADMLDTMYAALGRGLAAPQVGVLLRLFVMDATWKDGKRAPQVMVNPQITWRAPQHVWGEEGCLSLPGVTARVERAKEIRLRWSDLNGALHEETLTGFAAICAQHEYDHLDGILTLDRISPAERAAAEEALK